MSAAPPGGVILKHNLYSKVRARKTFGRRFRRRKHCFRRRNQRFPRRKLSFRHRKHGFRPRKRRRKHGDPSAVFSWKSKNRNFEQFDLRNVEFQDCA